MPAAKPVGLRDHLTIPEPVPAERVTVVQDLALMAFHVADGAPVPDMVTPAESDCWTVVPTFTDLWRLPGLTPTESTPGSGSMIRRESSTSPESPAACTVIVSTYIPGDRPTGFRDQRSV